MTDPADPIPSLSYHAMRMRWCRAALLAFLRRWGVYLVVGAAVVGGGSSGAVDTVRALCAWLVLPLFRAASEPLWLAPAVLLQAILGAALIGGMRPLLWSARWAAAERALPILRRDTLFSDSGVVALGLLPLTLLYGIGAQALIERDPAWLHPALGRALVALCVATAGSLMLGVSTLQLLRRPALRGWTRLLRWLAQANEPHPPPSHRRTVVTSPIAAAGWLRVLLWWPLWRGPAKRCGQALGWGQLVLCVPAIGLLWWTGLASWWLAAYAVLALLVVTRLNGLARLELDPLFRACAPLPLGLAPLQRGRELLALMPLLPSGLLLLACLPRTGVRPLVFAAYALVCLVVCVVEVRAAPADAAAKSSRWLFCIALMLALASEVMV